MLKEQENDRQKLVKAKELGISLIVFNTSEIKTFKDYRFVTVVERYIESYKR